MCVCVCVCVCVLVCLFGLYYCNRRVEKLSINVVHLYKYDVFQVSKHFVNTTSSSKRTPITDSTPNTVSSINNPK